MQERTVALAEQIREALQTPDGSLARLAEEIPPQDLAEALSLLEDPAEQALALVQLDEAQASQVLDYLEPVVVEQIFEHIPTEKAARLLSELPADDAAQILEQLEDEKAEALLRQMAPPEARDVRELLEYPPNTAGRLMVRQYVRVRPEWTVEQTLDYLRQVGPDIETIYYLYAVDTRQRLVGICSLREVVLSDPSKRIEQIMETDLVVVHPETDQEEVASLLSKYDLLAVPVVDELGRMLGIVTIDDVVDILVSESTEDVLKLGGVEATEEPYLTQTPWDLVRKRVRWLILLFIAERLTGTVLRHYDEEIQQFSALAWFIPLLIGTGGNAGSQTTTTITRALALGEVRLNQVLKVVGREMVTGVLLGLMIGVIGVLNAFIWSGTLTTEQRIDLALTVGLAQMTIITMATTIGAMLPLLAKRLNIDPAVMSAPFITTLIDAAGLLLYFWIAKLIIFS
ncbi:MAG: magnesium transporter [Armatimonadetes bacterium]|nr:magnesium transporter [Armatimonadota bacterium]CUU35747.1 magnesium transporter [Armatimonadetes bacterium DC]